MGEIAEREATDRRGCIKVVGAGRMRVRWCQRRNRHELVVGLSAGEAVLPGKVHGEAIGGGGAGFFDDAYGSGEGGGGGGGGEAAWM